MCYVQVYCQGGQLSPSNCSTPSLLTSHFLYTGFLQRHPLVRVPQHIPEETSGETESESSRVLQEGSAPWDASGSRGKCSMGFIWIKREVLHGIHLDEEGSAPWDLYGARGKCSLGFVWILSLPLILEAASFPECDRLFSSFSENSAWRRLLPLVSLTVAVRKGSV